MTANADHFLGWVTRLVHDHRARLIRVVRREGLSAEDALDVVQDAFQSFLTLPQARALVDAPEDSSKVLTVLARNLARNRRRRHDRAKPHLADDETLDALEADEAGPDQVVADAEAHAIYTGCAATLTAMQRAVVELRLVDNVAGEDVSRMLGTTPGNVAVHLHRAKQKLRACMSVLAR